MKTNKRNYNDFEEFDKMLKLAINYKKEDKHLASPPKVININKIDGKVLKMDILPLEDWFESIGSGDGTYFLDFDLSNLYKYNIHYSHYESGELLEMKMPSIAHKDEDPKKEFLDKLLFDLTLFNHSDPIVVYGKSSLESVLNGLSEEYYEYAKDIRSLLKRMIDMEQVFIQRWFWDINFRGNKIEDIYPVIYPSSENYSNSYAMCMIAVAIQCMLLMLPMHLEIVKIAA